MNSPTNPQAKRHLGQILIDQGILTEDQLRIALLEQMKSHLPVGRLLVQLGFVSEATLRDALSEKLGLQSVDLAHIIVDPAALKMLPRELARRYRMFPVALDRQSKRFIVALADTNNIVAVDQLRAHLKAEAAAVARTDVSGRTRLLADFHVVLARMLGNQVLAELLVDLLTRSSLIALMYQSSHSAEHSQEEHVAIVDALERRDARAAVRLLESHLGNVERNLRLNPRISDLASALQPA